MEQSSFKKIKKERLYDRINRSESWNSSFLNPNTILEKMAQKLGLKKKELLDQDIENPAMVQTLVEKELLEQTKLFFENNGMNYESFAQPI